jgi:hypothetical protein
VPSNSKLDACSNRYAHQIERLNAFTQAVQDPIAATRDQAVRRTLQEMLIVAVVAHLEEFLTCVIGLASFYREREFRDFLAVEGNEHEKAASQTCNAAHLMRLARRRVTFKKGGKPLARIFEVLLDSRPWPNDDTRRYVCDLVRVRNIIVHQGGWPDEEHARDVETVGVVVASHQFFWKLELDAFIGPALGAAALVGVAVTNEVQQHPRFRL